MTDRRRNSLILLVVAGLLIVSVLFVIVGIPGAVKAKKTRLGLDLKGGVELVYKGKPTAQSKVDTESLNRAAKAASEAGATAFRHRPLKIDREIRDYYVEFLAAEFPTLVPRYEALYGNSIHPGKDYERELEKRVTRVRARYDFRERPPRHREPETEQLQLAI